MWHYYTSSNRRSTMCHMTTLRAIIYVRLSSHRGDTDPSTSPARQEEVCRAYCTAKGWDVHPHVVRDLDVSGSDKGLRLDRPGLVAIRERWADVDVVVFAKLDRLARSVIDFRAFADEAASNGAALVSVAESLDLTTVGGRFVATILAAFAEMEAATIAERTSAGIDATRKLGRWAGGNPPYGYRVAPAPDGPGFVLAPDPGTAPVVREAAERVLSGETLYRVALDLNARGVPTASALLAREGRTRRNPAPWSTTALGRLLTNPAMIGRSVHRGEVLRGDDGMPRQLWEPLLPADDWRRLVATLRPATDGTPQRRRAARLLSGVVVCGFEECGRPLYATARTLPGGGTHAFYACAARRNGQECPGVAIGAEVVERHVTEEFLSTVGRWRAVRYEAVALDDGRRADVEASISDLARRMTKRGANVVELSGRLVALHAEREALPATAPTEVRRVETGQTFAEAWHDPTATVDTRRALLTSGVRAVRVRRGVKGRKAFDPSRVAVEWTESDEDYGAE